MFLVVVLEGFPCRSLLHYLYAPFCEENGCDNNTQPRGLFYFVL